MKLTMLVPKIAPEFSGAGRTGVRMFKGFLDAGLDVTLVTHTPLRGSPDRIRQFKSWGWRKRVPSGHALRKPLAGLSATAAVLEMVAYLRSRNPDVVYHMGCDVGPQLTGLAAQLLGIPVVAEATLMGSDDPNTIKCGRAGNLRFQLLRRSAALVSMSPRLHEAALEAGLPASMCHIIGNDVDVATYAPPDAAEKHRLREGLGIPHDATVVVSVGRLSPRKGMLELAEAFVRDVLRFEPRALLLLIGPSDRSRESAEYGRRLAYLAATVEPEGAIRLVGEVEEVAPWLRASDVFAFASREEGFGTVVAEAMACGLPLALRNIPLITEFIVGDTAGATVVDRDDQLGLAINQGIRVSSDPVVREDLRERAVRSFSKEVIHRRYLELFASVRKRSRGAP